MAGPLFPHANYVWLVTASLLAGGVNAVASGGSFISFPAMLGMGVPPVQANATNTVAIWPGQLTSILKLHGDLRRELLPVSLACSLIGGIGGAVILLHTPQSIFLKILPWMILLATVLFLFSGRISAWLARDSKSAHIVKPISLWGLTAMMLPVCLYIGYFGAGGGLLIMAALAVLGVEDMHQLNSMKVLVACLSNLAAVFTFIFARAVNWHYCLVSMVFAALGGWIGAHYARRLPQAALRWMVICVGFAVSGWFFWVNAHA